MKKHDDDLKIDISELFGGDLPSPSDTIEETAAPDAPVAQVVPAQAPESDNRFQEFIDNRNAELEAKTQELERRLQELQAQLSVSQTPPPLPVSTTPEVQEPPPVAPETPSAPPPIDFNAPIAPPFMGGSSAASVPVSSPEPVSASEPATAAAESAGGGEIQKLQEDHEFLLLYDEYRNIIAHELKDLVGDKKTFTMLGRTVELARGKFPEIFRNANWDAAGNLLEDGSVDSQRIIENKNTLDPAKAEAVLDAALSTLLNLRLQAVEKGLGSGLKNKVRAHMFQWITEKMKKAGPGAKNAGILKRLNSYLS